MRRHSYHREEETPAPEQFLQRSQTPARDQKKSLKFKLKHYGKSKESIAAATAFVNLMLSRTGLPKAAMSVSVNTDAHARVPLRRERRRGFPLRCRRIRERRCSAVRASSRLRARRHDS